MTPSPQTPPRSAAGILEALQKAVALDAAGDHAAARKLCLRVLKAQPDNHQALHLLGVVCHHSGDLAGAATHIKQALAIKREMPDAWRNLAHVQKDGGDWAAARASLDVALGYRPHNAKYMAAMGECHEKLGRVKDAAAWYQRALAVDPGLVAAHVALGTLLVREGQLSAGEKYLQKALDLSPGDTKALTNMAVLRGMQGRFDDVVPFYDRLLTLHPQNAEAHYARARENLARGKFAEGWAAFEWRVHCAGQQTQHGLFAQPIWQGEPLCGKKVLVWTEQGPGDEILIASMIADVTEQAAHCVVACSPRMVPIFARAFPSATVMDYAAAQKAHGKDRSIDYQISYAELGRYLRTSFADFPQRRAFLAANAGKTTQMRERYQRAAPGLPLVGISWHSASAVASSHKSQPLQDWTPVLCRPGISWVSLQYGDTAAALAATKKTLGVEVIHDADVDPLTDIDAFTAQVAAMDAVITTSNTTAHVAGALGKPVWVMVPASYGSPWYWFQNRTDSPWYPTAVLFRQASGESWAPVLRAAAKRLAHGLPA